MNVIASVVPIYGVGLDSGSATAAALVVHLLVRASHCKVIYLSLAPLGHSLFLRPFNKGQITQVSIKVALE